MHVNLFCKVGRSERQCLGTYPDEESANAAKAVKAAEMERSGVAPERVVFSTETVKGKGK